MIVSLCFRTFMKSYVPLQIRNQLKTLNFTTRNGLQVTFDSNGDPAAVYELINWQADKYGTLKFVTVGNYDSSKPRGQEFRMSRNISWVGAQTEVWFRRIYLTDFNLINRILVRPLSFKY